MSIFFIFLIPNGLGWIIEIDQSTDPDLLIFPNIDAFNMKIFMLYSHITGKDVSIKGTYYNSRWSANKQFSNDRTIDGFNSRHTIDNDGIWFYLVRYSGDGESFNIYLDCLTYTGVRKWSKKVNSVQGLNTNPRLHVVNASVIYVVWEFEINETKSIFLATTNNGGNSWDEQKINVTGDVNRNPVVIETKEFGISHPIVFFESRQGLDFDIISAQQHNGKWIFENITANTINEFNPDVIVDHNLNYYYVVFEKKIEGLENQIYAGKKGFSDKSWNYIRMSQGNGYFPSIDRDSAGILYSTWKSIDNEYENSERVVHNIHIAKSIDYGATWDVGIIPMKTDINNNPVLSVLDKSPYATVILVAWQSSEGISFTQGSGTYSIYLYGSEEIESLNPLITPLPTSTPIPSITITPSASATISTNATATPPPSVSRIRLTLLPSLDAGLTPTPKTGRPSVEVLPTPEATRPPIDIHQPTLQVTMHISENPNGQNQIVTYPPGATYPPDAGYPLGTTIPPGTTLPPDAELIQGTIRPETTFSPDIGDFPETTLDPNIHLLPDVTISSQSTPVQQIQPLTPTNLPVGTPINLIPVVSFSPTMMLVNIPTLIPQDDIAVTPFVTQIMQVGELVTLTPAGLPTIMITQMPVVTMIVPPTAQMTLVPSQMATILPVYSNNGQPLDETVLIEKVVEFAQQLSKEEKDLCGVACNEEDSICLALCYEYVLLARQFKSQEFRIKLIAYALLHKSIDYRNVFEKMTQIKQTLQDKDLVFVSRNIKAVKEEINPIVSLDVKIVLDEAIIKNIESYALESDINEIFDTIDLSELLGESSNDEKNYALEQATQLQNEIDVSFKSQVVRFQNLPGNKESTLIFIDLKNKKKSDVKKFCLVQIIPKDIALSSKDLTFLADTKIIRDDPIIMWAVDDLEAGGDDSVAFSVEGTLEKSQVDSLKLSLIRTKMVDCDTLDEFTLKNNVITGGTTLFEQMISVSLVLLIIALLIAIIFYSSKHSDIKTVLLSKISKKTETNDSIVLSGYDNYPSFASNALSPYDTVNNQQSYAYNYQQYYGEESEATPNNIEKVSEQRDSSYVPQKITAENNEYSTPITENNIQPLEQTNIKESDANTLTISGQDTHIPTAEELEQITISEPQNQEELDTEIAKRKRKFE